MWPRLGKITASCPFSPPSLALLYQLQQFRNECPAHLSLPDCIKEVIFPGTAKTEWEHKVKNTELDDDDEAWRAASREDSPRPIGDTSITHGRDMLAQQKSASTSSRSPSGNMR